MQNKGGPVQFRQRQVDSQLLVQKIHSQPLLNRVLCARNIRASDEVNYLLSSLLPPQKISNLEAAGRQLAEHIQKESNILIFGDYDADGASSTALCMRALGLLGHHNAGFILPDRFVEGYGVSEKSARRIVDLKPDLVITVDTGIASFKGLAKLSQAGIEVIVTDHHLPAETLPEVNCIVNPNAFPDSEGRNLAGVGVAFYLMLMCRIQLRESNWFEKRVEPNLAELLDLVAIGTVADLVSLDFNNRILVSEGLKRLRTGHCSTGINKLIQLTNRTRANLTSQDIAFALAPRINAAGRLDDMTIGVQALLANEEDLANRLTCELDNINRYRRELQDQMTEQALKKLPTIEKMPDQYGYVLHNDTWHEGIVGIIASKVKDITYRPTICFAPSGENMLKGSGRSISGVHLRDMLDLVDKSAPDLIERFGGHAMAAGLTIKKNDLTDFIEHFERVLQIHIDPLSLSPVIEHDGEIDAADMTMDLARLLRSAGPWGQQFPVPSFIGEFRVLDKKILVDKHIKFSLSDLNSIRPVDGILFFASKNQLAANYETIKLHYELGINEYRGSESLQLLIRHII